MPECKDIIYYVLSFLSICVTGVFSYLVWRATQKSNKVAQESYNLSQSIINSQQQLKSNVKDEYVRSIIARANEVIEVLTIQKSDLNVARIKEIPRNCGLSEIQLAEYFDSKERERINMAWKALEDYMDNCWTDKYGQFKGTFNGDELKSVKALINKPIDEFTMLINELEKIKMRRD